MAIVAGIGVGIRHHLEQKSTERSRSEARVLGKGIADAITQYYGDYNRLPKPASAVAGEDFTTDTSNAEGIIRILTGKEKDSDTMQNSRKINYLEGMRAARARTDARTGAASGSDKWAGGLIYEADNFEMVDFGGHYFRIRLDSNYDGEMVNPNSDEAGDGRRLLPNRVIVWGPGQDGKWETWDDNAKSWD